MSFDPNAAAAPDGGIYGLPFTAEEARVVVLPVPFAATTSYRCGAHLGPEAILEASKQVDLYDFACGRVYEPGIAMLPMPAAIRALHDEARAHAEKVIAAAGVVEGDATLEAHLAAVNRASAEVNRFVLDGTRALISEGKLAVCLGGDHAVPFGAIQAHAERYPGLGVLHVDAHADLRVAYEGFEHSHASIMHNVLTHIPGVARIVQVGVRDFSEQELTAIRDSKTRVVTHFDAELAADTFLGETWASQVGRIVSELPEQVYISFDIDGLEAKLCPNTGTPVPGGLRFQEAVALIEQVVRSGRRIVGLDLNEVAPDPTGKDDWDANVGARILYKMIGYALASQGELELRKHR